MKRIRKTVMLVLMAAMLCLCAAAAAQAGFQLYSQMRRALRRHAGELDAYRFENIY